MNQSKKILKSNPAEAKKKRGKWMEKLITFRRKLSEWWGNRSERQKMWVFYFVCAFVITLPYTSFLTRTYLAMWELNRNSNLTYRLGQSLSEEELREKFELHVQKNEKWNWYSLKEVNGNVEYVKYKRYPFEWLPISRYRITSVDSVGKNFCVFGITEGIKLEEVESYLRKRGYSEYKSWNEDKGYHKAGVVVSIKAIDGKVEHLSVGVVSFATYIDVVLPSEI